ncbi:cadherin-related family member 4 isoform X3 [Mauremys mutica]|uniref:cadherin-related family member 4 isoform X3 n=1 Tax=Mauremys mutica TaxID=74926 RepID=UPI001D1642C4|nr:cadherin-related family member 4 isoform X3 [Mauremys mutica]
MGPHGHQSFLLLLALCATGAFVSATVLSGLPTTVSVMESAGPGTIIVEFNLTCQNESSVPTPAPTLQSTPPTSFFNQPTVTHHTSPTVHYSVQITLSPSAALDAWQVNQYTLTLEATCPGEMPANGQLFVQIHTVDGPPQCMARFASQVGELVQVPEDVAPLTPIYTVVLRRPASGLSFTIEDNDTPLTIDHTGQVLAPGSGFIPAHAGQAFRLQILVTDRSRRNCSGAVTVRVLPIHHPHINFTVEWRHVAVLEKRGAMQLITQVQAQGDNVRYEIIAPAAHRLYTIDAVTGELRNTYQLDLQRSPEVAHTQLLVRAYNMLHPSDSDTMGLNITVLSTNTLAPRCSPAVFLAQVPEDTPIGWTLVTLTCMDPDARNSSLRYQVEGDQHSRYSFRMQGPQLQVNDTLDYDSAASARFQYVATILVTDSGQPPLSTRVPVLVTVTPKNEHSPACPASTMFSVPEDAAFGDTVGQVNGTDLDYPFNNIEYSIAGGAGANPPAFYIGPRTGEIHVLGPLDYESKQVYILTVQLRDVANDADPRHQRSVLCDITIQVQDTNDQPPRCTPPFQEFFIYSTRDPSLPLVQLQCSDEDKSTVLPLTYTLVGGNTNGRFRLAGNTLLHFAFSYPPDSIREPHTFELLVEVTDSLSTPHHSTTATLVVHVTPWATTTPSTTTTRTTLQKEPLVVTRTERFWAPSPWFVALLTVSMVLLLVVLAWLAWKLLGRSGLPLQQQHRSAPLGLSRHHPPWSEWTQPLPPTAPSPCTGSEWAQPHPGLSGLSLPLPESSQHSFCGQAMAGSLEWGRL